MRTHTLTLSATALALAGVVVAGCSSSSEETAAAGAGNDVVFAPRGTSGARLRAKFVAGGGARELVGFFDTARNEDCTFQRVADGRLLCLPRSVRSNVGATFADAACTAPVAVVPACASGVGYFASVASDRCGSRLATSLRPVVRPVTTTYARTSGGCTALPAGTSPAGVVELGAPVPWEQFVAAEESAAAKDGLTETVAVASDGARQVLGHRLDALGVECTLEVMGDGVARCVPSALGGQPLLYTDPSCSRAGYTFPIGSRSCGPDGSLLREKTRSGCSATRAVYSVAAGVDAIAPEGSLYSSSTSASGPWCSSTSSRPDTALRALTDITASLPAVQRLGRGEGRLAPALVAGASGKGLVPGFHDKERDVDCSFATASDGKIRCLPTAPSGVAFFTDTSCKSSTRVAAPNGEVSCADAESRFIRVEVACSGPGPLETGPDLMNAATTRVFEITGESRNLPAGSWQSAPGRCSGVAGINGARDAVEVDPAGFVEGTFVTE